MSFYNDWMERYFKAYYSEDKSGGVVFTVLAPDLEMAFKLARVQHPMATMWECLGRVSPDDPEVCLP